MIGDFLNRVRRWMTRSPINPEDLPDVADRRDARAIEKEIARRQENNELLRMLLNTSRLEEIRQQAEDRERAS